MNKITLFLPNFKVGGAERVTVTLANYFAKKNRREVEIVVLRDIGELKEELSEEVRVISLDIKSMKNQLFGLFKLTKILKESKPNELICVMWPLTIVGILANILSGCNAKIIVTDHTTFSKTKWIKSKFKRFIFASSVFIFYRLANHSVMVSNNAARDLETLSWLKKNSIKTIYNPIPIQKNITNNHDKKVKKIITVGSLKWAKNHELLIDSFKKVKESVPDSELHIVGEGERRVELEKQVLKLELAQYVTFHGLQTGRALEKLYSDSTLFVLSSHYEGFSMVIAEALSFGLPVVSVDCSYGPREIINNTNLGVLVPPGNVNALAEGIIKGINKNYDVNKLKSRAKFFSVEKIGNQYLELFESKDEI